MVVFYRKFPGHAETEPMPWVMDVEDEIPTLEELMRHAPPELGLSMELKFDEHSPCATPGWWRSCARCSGCAARTPRGASCFPRSTKDAALIMRALQGLYPVMMISDCHPHHPDPRRRSVAAAKRCALDGGLCGLVLNVKVLADGPEVADDVRASGLLLGTYGEENDDKPLATKQVEWGMCLVCTDNVAEVARRHVQRARRGRRRAGARRARRCFRRRWRRRRRRARWARWSSTPCSARPGTSFRRTGRTLRTRTRFRVPRRRTPATDRRRSGGSRAPSSAHRHRRGAERPRRGRRRAGLTEVASEARKSGFPIHARARSRTASPGRARRVRPRRGRGSPSRGSGRRSRSTRRRRGRRRTPPPPPPPRGERFFPARRCLTREVVSKRKRA